RAGVPLEPIAAQFGLGGSLIHTDRIFAHHHEIVPLYAAADLYVMPSWSDGFSLTLAEAMSCGTPVITVNRAALGEVAHGYALTIEEPNVDALTEAMGGVLGDPTLQRTLRERELERAKAFRWDITARRTLDVLRHVAAG